MLCRDRFGHDDLLRGQQHHHLPAFEPRERLDHAMRLELVPDAFQQAHPELLVRHFPPAEAQRDLGLVAFPEEPDEVPQLDLVIALVSTGSELHLLDLDLLELEPGLVLFLRFAVLELAEIHDPANRRLGHRRDLDQVEFRRFGPRPGIRERNNSELLTVFTNQADFGSGDFRVDPLLLFEGYCRFSIDDKKRPCPGGRVAP